MKSLNNNQILTAKEPDRRGRQSITPSENYENIYNRGRDCFRDLTQIAEILEDIEKHAHRFENAHKLIELFSSEKFEPILKAIFPTREQEGGPTDDRTVFEETKINVEKAIFASTVLKSSADYLLQAFPEQEYPNLHLRINELNKDLRGMVDAFNRTKELKRQLHEYKQHVNHFEPVDMGELDRNFNVECLSCRSYGSGRTEINAVSKIDHLPKCKADKKYDKTSRIWKKWYRIIPPKQLLITWKERKLLDKLSKH